MKNKKSISPFLAFIVLSLIVMALLVCWIIKIQKTRTQESYYKTINNPPCINDVEEELEAVLVSKFVVVYDIKRNGHQILYYVTVDKTYQFVALYEMEEIQGSWGRYYEWRYVSSRFIGWKECENE